MLKYHVRDLRAPKMAHFKIVSPAAQEVAGCIWPVSFSLRTPASERLSRKSISQNGAYRTFYPDSIKASRCESISPLQVMESIYTPATLK